MEKRFRLLLLLALLLTAATGAWAQEQWDVVWDFTAWSTETVTALKADAAASKLEGWSDVEKKADAEADADPTEASKDNCFWFAGTVNEDGSLSANGAVIKELKGLKFNSDYAAQRKLAIAVNYPSTSLGDYAGGAYLWLGGGGSKQTCPCFTIPGVKAGSKITIEVESNKPSDGRGIGLYKNSYAAENLIGEQFKPTAKEAKTWEIAEDCDVVVWNTKDCHIYTIKVKAPAAAAPAGYTVTLKDGVKDADKWTVKVGEGQAQALPIGGLKGDGSETVTLKYNGRLKVKSVKAVKKEVIKPDLLSGVFSVSASKKVNFSKGNLQATYDGSNWTWAFANNQWDYIGNSAGNTKVTDASPFISENGTVDLFGWVGASSTWDGVNQYGITSSKARNATNGYGNSATENLKKDWGTLMGTGWRTLTKDEWDYMLNSRSGTRYCKAQVNSKSGLVIFPDGYSHPTGPTAPTNTNSTSAAYTTNSWSGEAWTKMENAGCVFLPAAGSRDGNSVSNAGTAGTYWWSTHYEGGGDAVDRAYNLYFTNNYLLPTAGSYRNMGCSVRLVREVTE